MTRSLEEEIDVLKNEHIDFIKNNIQTYGEFYPCITIFSELKEINEDEPDLKFGMVHIPIDRKFLQDDESKDNFIKEVVPNIFKEIQKTFIPHAVLWCSEVWMRRMPKKDKITQEDIDELYKNGEKIEAVFITMESKNKNETFVYEIIRNGVQVSPDGDLVDKIQLKKSNEFDHITKENIGGRFSNLFGLFK
jgi:hypothetical protein